MPIFRATVYHCSLSVLAVEGYNPTRFITEHEAENEGMFEADIRDHYLHDVDADIVFGPIGKPWRFHNDNKTILD
jgi:hypothetical protein